MIYEVEKYKSAFSKEEKYSLKAFIHIYFLNKALSQNKTKIFLAKIIFRNRNMLNFKQLDFFSKAKEEIDSATGVGGLLSLIGIIVTAKSQNTR